MRKIKSIITKILNEYINNLHIFTKDRNKQSFQLAEWYF